MRFTKLQQEIIDHRLEMPDCLMDCLDDVKALDGYDLTDYTLACIAVSRAINKEITPSKLTPIQRAVLEESIYGSTYCDMIDDAVSNLEVSPQRASAARRAWEDAKDRCAGISP